MSDRVLVELTISGRVQGVGYRAWLARAAEAEGLEGWVRNRRDGSVQAILAGPAQAVEAVARAAERGPPHAAVVTVARAPGSEAALAARPAGRAFAMLATG